MQFMHVLLVLLSIWKENNAQVRLYHTFHPLDRYGSHHCLYHYGNTSNGQGRSFISYCLRPSVDPSPTETRLLSSFGEEITFAELRRMNISKDLLFEWFIPVDTISNYIDNSLEDSQKSLSKCQRGSFGDRCEYYFAFEKTDTLDDVLEKTFSSKQHKQNIDLLSANDMTCLILLNNCTTYTGICLDWRQICDGLRDCINGEDEARCLEKELSECNTENEYRCRSGHCVPRTFLLDLTVDCPEADDEQRHIEQSFKTRCAISSNVECEEHSCGLSHYSCGDGECHDQTTVTECTNQRNTFLFFKSRINQTVFTVGCKYHESCTGRSLSNVNRKNCFLDRCWSDAYNAPWRLDRIFYSSESFFLFPFIRLLYDNPTSNVQEYAQPTFVCFNRSMCRIPPPDKDQEYQSLKFDDYICYERAVYISFLPVAIHTMTELVLFIQSVFSSCASGKTRLPSSPSVYICKSGLVISAYRQQDSYSDCSSSVWYGDEDEQNYDNPTKCLNDRLICGVKVEAITTGPYSPANFRCVQRRFLSDQVDDCTQDKTDEMFPVSCVNNANCQHLRDLDFSGTAKPSFGFRELCNGYTYKSIVMNDTDETDCDEWPCNARYNRCNGVWNKRNGCDELNCPNSVTSWYTHNVSGCALNEHYCAQFNSTALACISLDRVGDGKFDCLFGTDERATLLVQGFDHLSNEIMWGLRSFCWPYKISAADEDRPYVKSLCDRDRTCPLAEDELLCAWHEFSTCTNKQFTCKNGKCIRKEKRCNDIVDCPEGEDEWLCDLQQYTAGDSDVQRWFKNDDILNFESDGLSLDVLLRSKRQIQSDTEGFFFCHRGILLKSKDGPQGMRCLCPPSYYGDRCQYENGRLTVSFLTQTLQTFDPHTILRLVFYLLDELGHILSHETLLHIPQRQSGQKHLIYLVYPRNKSMFDKNLSVRIDAYKVTTSSVSFSLAWYFPVQFSFLPVNRLAVKLLIDEQPINRTTCQYLRCEHGICQSYANSARHFCYCHHGWKGDRCEKNVTSDHTCNSLSGKTVRLNEHAFCLCAIGHLGKNCAVRIIDRCVGLQCENGGKCEILDERLTQRVCMCTDQRYFGDRCQLRAAQLILEIPASIAYTPLMTVHMLHSPVTNNMLHRNIFTYRNIQPNSQLSIYDLNNQYLPMFIFVQLFNKPESFYGAYYLIALIKSNISNLTTRISLENYCPHISERLDPQTLSLKWLKRVKLYHKFFSNVKCFYDEIYMCLVDRSGILDCFNYNHGVNNCTEGYYCENGGQCLQSKQLGQLYFTCVCPECFYGLFCQLTMQQYFLTLDSILGSEILTDESFPKQSPLIKSLTVLVIVILFVGIVSNVCSALTFSHAATRKVGCGYYLFFLSIVAPLTLVIFAGRFAYLLIAQIRIVENKVTCMAFDAILNLFIAISNWITVCVACERTTSMIKGINFKTKHSVQVVKYVIPILIVALSLTSVHQIFTRTLVADPRSDERHWCVIQYPSISLQTYDTVLNLFNNIVPFLINFISAIVLFVCLANQKQRTAGIKRYIGILKKQINQHKDLLISPMVMIVCRLPVIIVIVVIKCIKTKRQMYVALSAYILSLLPLTLTFFIFVLPSPFYKKIFNEKRLKLFRKWK